MEKLYTPYLGNLGDESFEYEEDGEFKLITAKGQWAEDRYGGSYCINATSILTKLIQDTGRFALRYASDLFLEWQTVLEYLKEYSEAPERADFVFGIREDGVSTAADAANLSSQRHVHRAIYVLRVFKGPSDVTMELHKATTVKRAPEEKKDLLQLQMEKDPGLNIYTQCSKELSRIIDEMGLDDGGSDVKLKREDAFFSYYEAVLEKGLEGEERREELVKTVEGAFY